VSTAFDFESVAHAALAQANDLLQRWFPAGKFRGQEFVVGDLSGAAGESLSINIRTGRWADFSTDDRGGDLISLFAAMHRINQIEAAKQLSDILGGVSQITPRTAQVTSIRSRESVEWDGIFPIPSNAPPPPTRHPEHGAPKHVAHYRDTEGNIIAFVYRCEPEKGKQVVPLTYCRNTKTGEESWRWQSLPKPRSLYRAELLHQFPDAPILLVEGEPKCDLANETLPDNWIALSWPNGAASWKYVQWAMLSNRDVTIWPDADKPGREAAAHIAEQLPHYGARPTVLTPPDGVPEGWDVGDAVRDGWDADRLLAFIAPQKLPKRALWYSDEAWVEADIPPREWLAKGYIERGCVTVVAGAGAVGKSMLLKAWSVAAILGVGYHRFNPCKPMRVLSYNVEDDLREERRRLSATVRQFNCKPADLVPNLRTVGPNDIGTLIERDAMTGRVKLTDAMVDLLAHIEEFKPDIVMLDPMVELHTSDENDNTGLRAVVAQLRGLAEHHKLAVILAHHVRKGAIVPGDPDGIRGAGAIVGAARVTFTVCPMSEEEAKNLGISIERRKFYFRLDGAKINHAPIEEAEWFRRDAYALDNGEDVAAAVPWIPPQDAISLDTIETIKAAISRGIDGEAYTFRAGTTRSIINLYRDNGISTAAGGKEMSAHLTNAGFEEVSYKRKNRVIAKGIRSPEGTPFGIEWEA